MDVIAISSRTGHRKSIIPGCSALSRSLNSCAKEKRLQREGWILFFEISVILLVESVFQNVQLTCCKIALMVKTHPVMFSRQIRS